jgi:hypothetical protein
LDALTALANGLNLRAKLVYAGGVCGQWLMDHNSDKSIWFHLVSKGRGWVHSPAWAVPLELADGDLILFMPHAEQHFLSYSPAHVPSDTDGTRLSHRCGARCRPRSLSGGPKQAKYRRGLSNSSLRNRRARVLAVAR